MSDHISGPRALADPIADITDVYAFPSPERPGSPRARHEHAADGQAVRPVLRRPALPLPAATARPAGAAATGGSSSPATDGVRPRLRLLRPATTSPSGHRCRTAPAPPRPGSTVSFRVNDPEGGAGHGIRVFAGARWDPFIMDARAALATIATQRAGVHRPRLDLPRRQERPQHRRRARRRGSWAARPLVGVVAETLTRGDVQRPDRTGRPARGEEHDARAEGVRPGQPGPGDPRPLQHGGRVPPRRLLRRRLPRAAERQPRLLGRPRRQGGLAPRTRTATTR